MNSVPTLPDVFSQDPDVMSGALVFRGTRILAQIFFDHLDQGGTVDQFLDWYDGVSRDQLVAAADWVECSLAEQHGSDRIVAAAWKDETDRRIAEIESGKVKGVPLEESLSRARKIAGL